MFQSQGEDAPEPTLGLFLALLLIAIAVSL